MELRARNFFIQILVVPLPSCVTGLNDLFSSLPPYVKNRNHNKCYGE